MVDMKTEASNLQSMFNARGWKGWNYEEAIELVKHKYTKGLRLEYYAPGNQFIMFSKPTVSGVRVCYTYNGAHMTPFIKKYLNL